MILTAEQHDILMSPLRATRVAKRQQGGKTLSYVEAWEIRTHLIRVFGFGNFDIEVLESKPLGVREYKGQSDKAMVEPMWWARVRLTVRTRGDGEEHVTVYTEDAIGSASGPDNLLADLHDNAVKTAASDALKRCAMNLGTQFGLSLYNDGALVDQVRMVLVRPDGATLGAPREATAEQEADLAHSLGSQTTDQGV